MSLPAIILVVLGIPAVLAWVLLGPCPQATFTANCWDGTPRRWWPLALIRDHSPKRPSKDQDHAE